MTVEGGVKFCSKMIRILAILSIFFMSAHADGEVTFLRTPSSLSFKGTSRLDSNFLGDVIAASLGHSVQENTNWDGMYINDPFDLARSSVTFVVDGVEQLHFPNKVHSYPLAGAEAGQSLKGLTSLLHDYHEQVIDLDLSKGPKVLSAYSDILGDVSVPQASKPSTTALKPNLYPEDKHFLQQIAVIDELAKRLSTYEKLPTQFTIRIKLIRFAQDSQEYSPAFTEAVKLLTHAIENFKAAANKAYKNNLLFTVATNKEALLRHKRQAKSETNATNYNLATYYSEDYPVIFNIVLWFGVVMVFSLLAISYAIATMDPGRDSIIYRMTSTRMKKDN